MGTGVVELSPPSQMVCCILSLDSPLEIHNFYVLLFLRLSHSLRFTYKHPLFYVAKINFKKLRVSSPKNSNLLFINRQPLPAFAFSSSPGEMSCNKGRGWWSQARTLQGSLITWKMVSGLWPESPTKKGNSSCSPTDKLMSEVRMKII